MHQRGWLGKFKNIRENLEVGQEERPWTDRPGVQLRGLRRQVNPRNFLHENINCRWAKFCRYIEKDFSHVPEVDVCTDYGKSDDRQRNNGSIVLHTNSHVYWHNRDRSLCPEEHFALQGWDADDVNLEGLTNPWPNDILDALHPDTAGQKRRKVKVREHDVSIRRMLGNSMNLAEIGPLMLASYLAQNNGMYENGPTDVLLPLSDADNPRIKALCVNVADLDKYERMREGDAPGSDASSEAD